MISDNNDRASKCQVLHQKLGPASSFWLFTIPAVPSASACSSLGLCLNFISPKCSTAAVHLYILIFSASSKPSTTNDFYLSSHNSSLSCQQSFSRQRWVYLLDYCSEVPQNGRCVNRGTEYHLKRINSMASGINIYSLVFQISKNYSRCPKKNLSYLKYWHINFRYLKKFQISEITISGTKITIFDIRNKCLFSNIRNCYFGYSK